MDNKAATFNVAMQVWTDKTFATEVAKDYTVQVPGQIYISATLTEGLGTIALQGRKCWATPRYHLMFC